jgi:hypothetical protein
MNRAMITTLTPEAMPELEINLAKVGLIDCLLTIPVLTRTEYNFVMM